MRYVAAYLLGGLSGKEPTQADIERILGSVGVEIDSEKLDKVFKSLKGKNVEDLITKGRGKLASMPVGGGAVAASASSTPAAAAAPEKKEEKKEPEKEDSESDDDMGFGLFD